MSQLPVDLLIEYTDPNNDFNIKNYEEQFFLGYPFQKGYSLINSGGFKSVDISNLFGTLEKIIVIPRDEFTPPAMTTIRFFIDNTVDPPFHIDMPIQKYFLWNVHPDFVPYITGMSIKTDSVTSIQVDVILITTVEPPDVE